MILLFKNILKLILIPSIILPIAYNLYSLLKYDWVCIIIIIKINVSSICYELQSLKNNSWINEYLLCSWTWTLAALVNRRSCCSLETFYKIRLYSWIKICSCCIHCTVVFVFTWTWGFSPFILKTRRFSDFTTTWVSVFWIKIMTGAVERRNDLILTWSQLLCIK